MPRSVKLEDSDFIMWKHYLKKFNYTSNSTTEREPQVWIESPQQRLYSQQNTLIQSQIYTPYVNLNSIKVDMRFYK